MLAVIDGKIWCDFENRSMLKIEVRNWEVTKHFLWCWMWVPFKTKKEASNLWNASKIHTLLVENDTPCVWFKTIDMHNYYLTEQQKDRLQDQTVQLQTNLLNSKTLSMNSCMELFVCLGLQTKPCLLWKIIYVGNLLVCS